jgi:hypothetical protein
MLTVGMLPFSISIALLSLAQGATVAVPRAWDAGGLARLRSRRWALIPPASVIGFVLIASLAERASADGLTYLALIAVPVLAALALGWLAWNADPPRPTHALLVIPLFALAWADRGALPGQAAALILTALSCAALGAMLTAVTPPRWLAAGIVAMAVSDTALVVSDLLQKPNNALNAAHPAAGLPRLQSAAFGSALMGYGDLFIAAVLGALLATALGRRSQLRGARGAARALLRPAVLLRGRAPGDGAGRAHAACSSDRSPARSDADSDGAEGSCAGDATGAGRGRAPGTLGSCSAGTSSGAGSNLAVTGRAAVSIGGGASTWRSEATPACSMRRTWRTTLWSNEPTARL